MGKNTKYIIVTFVVTLMGCLYFVYGTTKYDGQKDFDRTKASNVVKTGENLTFLVKQSVAISHPKVLDMFGNIDQNAITVMSSMSSIVQSIVKEGTHITKGRPVVSFVNGVSKPMPFNGILLDVFTKKGDDIKIGDKLFMAIPTDVETMNINLEVPVTYTQYIFSGTPVHVIYNDKQLEGTITYIGQASNDGIIKAVATLNFEPIPHNAVAKVQVEISQHKTHFVPKTAVILSGNSAVVKIITENNQVSDKLVEIIDENDEGFYISNLDDTVRIIVRNPYYANTGKTYKYIESNE